MTSFNSIADLKKALSKPNAIVLMDRNDFLAPTLKINPEKMAQASEPRKVQVRSKDFVFIKENGEKSYLNIPKKDEVSFSGNTFSLKEPSPSGTRTITYRIEDERNSFSPSKLAENHPPLSQEEINKKEKEAKEKIEKEKNSEKERLSAHQEAFEKMKNMPPPQAAPEYELFHNTMKEIITRELEKGVPISNEKLTEIVREELGAADFGTFKQHEDFHTHATSPVAPYVQSGIQRVTFGEQPRGSWQKIVLVTDRGESSHCADIIVSTGGPQKASAFLIEASKQTDENIKALLLQEEVYTLRETVSREIAARKEMRAIKELNLHPGQELGKVKINGTLYSSVTVVAVSGETGDVTLHLKKTRSRSLHQAVIKAATLAHLMGKQI